MTRVDRPAVASERDLCVECGLIRISDVDDSYCPWCGSRVPEPFELLAWGEVRAAEEAAALDRADRRRVA